MEPIIFGWRGNLNELTNGRLGVMSSNIITHQQISSGRKPVEFYQRLRSWTREPRIDIFARLAHEGYDGWGDEYVSNGPLEEYLVDK